MPDDLALPDQAALDGEVVDGPLEARWEETLNRKSFPSPN